MTHWKLSEGNIDALEGKEDQHMHLMSTVDFYKGKIAEMKQNHADLNLFDDQRKYKVEEKNGEEWKEFDSEHRADVLKME